MNDLPAQRTIRIGKANVGLIGLDQALAQVMSGKERSEEEAVSFLFAEMSRQNYVPEGKADLYKEALRNEYRKRTGKQTGQSGRELVIRVLGPGCVSCNKLNTMLIAVLHKLNLAADMESVHDLDEIWRYGVLNTPALVINNEVKSSGKMPTPAQIEEWIKEAVAEE